MKKLPLILSAVILLTLLSMNTAKVKPLTAKDIERQLVKVTDTLYVSKFECTNKIYNTFLADLLAKGLKDEYEKCKIDTASWSRIFPGSGTDPMARFYHIEPNYLDYPAICMSHEAAQSFCRWLNKWYASQPDIRYKNITFSLPTFEEWEKVTSYPKEIHFPWPGNELKDKGAKYKANYKVVWEEAGQTIDGIVNFRYNYGADGYMFPAPVETYKPNGRRLYNLSGNVAEMLNEPGVHKGGSWNSPGYMLRFDAPDEYAGITTAHPCIGFRFVAHIYPNSK